MVTKFKLASWPLEYLDPSCVTAWTSRGSSPVPKLPCPGWLSQIHLHLASCPLLVVAALDAFIPCQIAHGKLGKHGIPLVSSLRMKTDCSPCAAGNVDLLNPRPCEVYNMSIQTDMFLSMYE